MKSTIFGRGALSVAVAAISLAGCSGTQPPAGNPSASVAMTTRSGIVPAVRTQRQHTWMSPALRGRRDLLYVSDPADGLVVAYDYKSGKQLGSAGGFRMVYGGCSDKKGNVYFVDFTTAKITEFADGSLTPVKTLTESVGSPIGCSVNPTNGDLAVTNFQSPASSGGVAIYKNATGSPTTITAAKNDWPAGYDPNGNLFIVGLQGSCLTGCLEELPAGGNAFEKLTLSGFKLNFPAAAQWDGKYLGVGDQACNGADYTCIFQVSVSGSTATAVSTVELADPCGGAYVDVVAWANLSKKPNDVPKKPTTQIAGSNIACTNTVVDKWAYPAGGAPSGQLGVVGPAYGAVIVSGKWKGSR